MVFFSVMAMSTTSAVIHTASSHWLPGITISYGRTAGVNSSESTHKTLELLNIPYEQINKDYYRVEFTINSAKAFMLIHIFMHELGHHLDRMTSRRQEYCGRGEEFAENWALIHETEMYERYCRYYRI